MLASYVDTKIKQHDIIIAANVQKSYRERGMTIGELGKGLRFLCPDLTFWYKNEASVADLDTLINTHQIPVGIEWQGAFGQYADEDSGHYSVVTAIDLKENTIALSDPFYYFAGTDRVFPIDEFISRWWDENEVIEPDVPAGTIEKDIQPLFLITKIDHQFSEDLHLLKY